jgi:hypothetical protein
MRLVGGAMDLDQGEASAALSLAFDAAGTLSLLPSVPDRARARRIRLGGGKSGTGEADLAQALVWRWRTCRWAQHASLTGLLDFFCFLLVNRGGHTNRLCSL